jgi:hypothetical protein
MSEEKKEEGFKFSIPDVTNIDIRNVSPLFGVASPSKDADFIVTSMDGKQSSARMFYETGLWWLIGFTVGGLHGIKEGWSGAAHANWRLRLNGVMNGMSKNGGKLSNLLAIVGKAFQYIYFFKCNNHCDIF